ncbi:MAG TPA: EAL domain-containing protein [Abditibacteriaceae bacterium]|jgi:diguanylate cyclase (GGDEF)-like protein
MSVLRVLHIEDDLQDAERVQGALAKAGYACVVTRISTEPALQDVLENEFDVILSRYDASQDDKNLNGLAALALCREKQAQTPFLFVSSGHSDDILIKAIHAGAYDFISKRRLVRLAPAIERARREAQEISDLQQAQKRQIMLAEGLRAILLAADELVACPDLDTMYRRAVELAREKLGIERIGLFLCDVSGEVAHGTYGTDFQGQTTNETNIICPVATWWAQCLEPQQAHAKRWLVKNDEPYSHYGRGAKSGQGSGWVAATPLVASHEVIGVMFNDTAISGAPIDETEQELLAVYGSFLANLIIARRTAGELRSVTARARCILFDAFVEEQLNTYMKWQIRFTDETAAQRVLPLDVPLDSNYFEALAASRHPEDQQRMMETMPERAAIDAGLPSYHQEYRCIDKFGVWHWLFEEVTLEPLPALPDGRRRFHAAGVCTDITARRRAEEQLRRNAFYDPLTGLANRSLFLDRLNRSFQRAKRHDHLFAVLFLDLDKFKSVNDTLGHESGDEFLIGVAHRLEACLRPGDTAARFGGDEFAILLDGLGDVNDAIRVAERTQEELALPFQLTRTQRGEKQETVTSRHEVLTTASIGIALSRVPGDENSAYQYPEELLRDADTAMYRAKALGRNRHEVFDINMHARAIAELRTENELRRALGRNEFVLHYQPVCQSGGEIVGFEALLRWDHPVRGLLSPDEFMEIAEGHGWLVSIGEWTLREACRQLCEWRQQKSNELFVSVNLSARQFAQSDLPIVVQHILEETGLPPSCLQLEIAEKVLMHNPASSETLRRLKKTGVRLALDNFGTGFSSLLWLQLFGLDELKIDRSLISESSSPETLGGVTNADLVGAMVVLARSLGANAIAEGVENETQWNEVRALGCTGAQGYFFKKPLPPHEAAVLLDAVSPTL